MVNRPAGNNGSEVLC